MTIKWISIKECKPIPWQKVLITNGDQIVTAAMANYRFHEDGRIWWDGCHFSGDEWEWEFNQDDITHWAILPIQGLKEPADKRFERFKEATDRLENKCNIAEKAYRKIKDGLKNVDSKGIRRATLSTAKKEYDFAIERAEKIYDDAIDRIDT